MKIPTYDEVMDEYYDDWQKKKNAALAEVTKHLSKYKKKKLLGFIKSQEDEYKISEYRIEDEPGVDDYQDEYGFNVYISQYSSGESGDNFAGTCWLEITPTVYLTYNFEC
jgi:hypothetical protein